ncbi:MAG: DNRLRE domain-containing protein, partial [Erysipelotrichaceae bacterium]|nr:DNRLRE domain-containing protein [Erysipelotrichaceae bacterium]
MAEGNEENIEEPVSSEPYDEGDNYTVYENNDGSYTLDYYFEPVTYADKEKNSGSLTKSTIDDREVYVSSDNRSNISFPTYLDQEDPIEIEYDNYSAKLSLRSKSNEINDDDTEEDDPDGKLEVSSFIRKESTPDKIVYSDEDSGTDIVYYPRENGIKEEIVLYDMPSTNSFSFFIEFEEAFFKTEENGSIGIYKNDERVAEVSPPFMEDADGIIDDQNVFYKLSENEYGSAVIDLIVNEVYLKEASYPLVIDPTVVFITDGDDLSDAYVNSSSPALNYCNSAVTILPFGAQDNGAVYRSYISFDGLQDLIEGKSISSASLSLYLKTVPDTGSSIEIHRIDQSWNPSTVTWNSQPTSNNVASASNNCG